MTHKIVLIHPIEGGGKNAHIVRVVSCLFLSYHFSPLSRAVIGVLSHSNIVITVLYNLLSESNSTGFIEVT